MTKDANKKSIEAEYAQVGEDISAELAEWDELGVAPPQSIKLDSFLVDNTLFSIIEFLSEEGIIDNAKFKLFKQKRLLGRLRTAREEITPAVKAARIKAGIQKPDVIIPPGILGYNGEDKKH